MRIMVEELATAVNNLRQDLSASMGTTEAFRIDDREMICKRIDTLRPVVDHCHRLLREKETLQKMIYPTTEEMGLRQVNAFMAAPSKWWP